MSENERGMEAPPVIPGELDHSEPPGWPKVVGIVSLVYAGLGLVCTGCGMLSPVVMAAFMPEDMEVPPAMTPGPMMWLLMIVGVLMIGVLIAAGIMTLSRRAAGRGLHLAWAGVSIPMSFVGLALQLAQQQEIAEWAKAHPDSPFAQGQGSPMALIGPAIGLLIGLAWPSFCLIWFGLMKKNPEVGRREIVA